ncbi:MAG TPA: Yip1 family protein [Gemmatimonadales bacterium]|nr:Yip1 family protein [Gemmatimonadales bacterium]
MNLVDRVKRILLSPRTEWEVIDAEQTTPAALYTGYIAPLAAIGPIARLIGYTVFGIPLPLVGTYRVPFGSALSGAVTAYVLTLAGTYILALIVDALAPTFNGQRNQIQALKVAAYSSTAAWVAGIFTLIPWLGFLGIAGLYSLYLLYLGLPVLMKAPREKALPYTAVVILAAIVLFMVVGVIAGRFTGIPHAVMTMP